MERVGGIDSVGTIQRGHLLKKVAAERLEQRISWVELRRSRVAAPRRLHLYLGLRIFLP